MARFKTMTAVAAAAAVSLLVNVSPAHAEGAGVSVGYSEINANLAPAIPPCATTSGVPKIFLTNAGTVGVVDPDPLISAAEYAGTFQTTFQLEQFSFNPAGTFKAGSNCVGTPLVAVTSWSASGTSPLGTISCSGGAGGTYTRVTNVYEIAVRGTCTVTTAGRLAATGPVTFSFTGNQNPCFGDFGVPNCEGPLNNTEFEGVYAQLPV